MEELIVYCNLGLQLSRVFDELEMNRKMRLMRIEYKNPENNVLKQVLE